MSAYPPGLLDVTDEADEVTAKHAPDLSLLRQTDPTSGPRPAGESGIARVRQPPPPRREATKIRLLPLACLRSLLERYTECAGPAARPLMLREIAKLNATPERFPLLLRGELLAALAARLDDHATRQRFIDDARVILEDSPSV